MCVDVCVFVSSPKHPLEAIIDMEKKIFTAVNLFSHCMPLV